MKLVDGGFVINGATSSSLMTNTSISNEMLISIAAAALFNLRLKRSGPSDNCGHSSQSGYLNHLISLEREG